MDRSYLVLDIETIIDPELPIPSESSPVERLPAPPHHQIVVIGVLWFDRNYTVVRTGVIGEGKSEADALGDFARFVEERQPDLVTFNGRGFDLPVLASRCLRHGVPFSLLLPVPGRPLPLLAGRAPRPDGLHLRLWRRSAVRLDVIAKLCGMPGKVGVDGKDVGPMVHAGQHRPGAQLLPVRRRADRRRVPALQLLRGELTPQAYRDAIDGLIDRRPSGAARRPRGRRLERAAPAPDAELTSLMERDAQARAERARDRRTAGPDPAQDAAGLSERLGVPVCLKREDLTPGLLVQAARRLQPHRQPDATRSSHAA